MIRLLIASVILAVSAPASALELWDDSSGGALFTTAPDERPFAEEDHAYFRDSSGAEYEVISSGGVFVSCRPSENDEWRSVINGPQSISNYTATAGIVNDRLVAIMAHRVSGWDTHIWNLRCDEVWASAPGERVGAISPRPKLAWPSSYTSIPPVGFKLQGGLWDYQGKACAVGQNAIWCYDFDSPGMEVPVEFEAPQLGSVVEDADISTNHLKYLWNELFQPPVEYSEEWNIIGARGLVDGRLALTLGYRIWRSGSGGTTGPLAISWLVMREADGTWRTLLEGAPRISSGTTHDFQVHQFVPVLGSATDIYYEPTWDALVVGPVRSWQPDGSGDNTELRGSANFGIGYRVVPLEGRGSGYLDLTKAWRNTGECYFESRLAPCTIWSGSRGIALWGNQLHMRLNVGNNFKWKLNFDPLDVDLDGDGLSWSEEVDAGTSDFLPDFDGDLAFDGPEVRAGTSPTTPDGDAMNVLPTAFIPSPLFGEYVLPSGNGRSVVIDDLLGIEMSPNRLSARGPLCRLNNSQACGTCLNDRLEVVGEWCTDAVVGAQVSYDGNLLVYPSSSGLNVLDFETGEDRMWITREALAPYFDDIYPPTWRPFDLHFYAIDKDNLWVVNTWGGFSDTRRAIHVDGTGNATRIFDLREETCEKRQIETQGRPCVDSVPGQLVAESGRVAANDGGQFVVGYLAEEERLLVASGGSPENYLIGIHRTEPPIEIARTRTMKSNWRESYARSVDAEHNQIFPAFMTELDDGFFQVDDHLWGRRLDHVERNPWAPQLWPEVQPRLHGIWGDTIVDARSIEWVRYERKVRPGDSLLLARDTFIGVLQIPGYMLYNIGPRGGANPLWESPNREIRGVTGMHYRDERLCVADRVGQKLLEFSVSDSQTDIPDTESLRVDSIDVIDCHYDREGNLLALVGNPTYAVVRVAEDGSYEPLEGSSETGVVLGIVDTPDGWEVARVSPPDLRGILYDADGVRRDLRANQTPDPLAPDDVAHAVLRADQHFLIAIGTTSKTAEASEVQVPWRGPSITLADGSAVPATYLAFQSRHNALAQVPGGDGLNPWSGVDERTSGTNNSNSTSNNDGGDSDMGGGSGADMGGEVGSDDESCLCATSSRRDTSPAYLLALLALLGIRRL